jgi:hypothetical protein
MEPLALIGQRPCHAALDLQGWTIDGQQLFSRAVNLMSKTRSKQTIEPPGIQAKESSSRRRAMRRLRRMQRQRLSLRAGTFRTKSSRTASIDGCLEFLKGSPG